MTKTLALVQSGVAAGGHSSSKHPGVFIPADRRRGAAAATTQKPHLVTWHQESQPHPTRQDMPGPVAEAEGLVFPYQSHRVSQGVTARRTLCSGPSGVYRQDTESSTHRLTLGPSSGLPNQNCDAGPGNVHFDDTPPPPTPRVTLRQPAPQQAALEAGSVQPAGSVCEKMRPDSGRWFIHSKSIHPGLSRGLALRRHGSCPTGKSWVHLGNFSETQVSKLHPPPVIRVRGAQSSKKMKAGPDKNMNLETDGSQVWGD